jgi:hypothetical protein
MPTQTTGNVPASILPVPLPVHLRARADQGRAARLDLDPFRYALPPSGLLPRFRRGLRAGAAAILSEGRRLRLPAAFVPYRDML